MDGRLQRRIQRYGWDRAAADYEPLWRAQLDAGRMRLLELMALAPGERVLDGACGTGLVAIAAARAVGPVGHVTGTDLSDEMVTLARRRATDEQITNTTFAAMPAERLSLPDHAFDVAFCAFGLMYVTDAVETMREMRRVLRPGGRLALAVWGERARCGWSPVFPIVEAEVASDVCPMFFNLGQQDRLARVCAEAGLTSITQHRFRSDLVYASGADACGAAFIGGPVALAWSRFTPATRARVFERYLDAIAPYRNGEGYRLPGEFVLATAHSG
jgi:ubiquinone/menaquinone biosynthesis C-methylase UbiE